ncbi:Flp family type IVb pilin [Sphingomonas sp.]|uniref:Flp family type IVb pilin n=1 Tax=Sphingomonas sp. TaxID=28214 RepID=UPI00286BC453|nr:Flp family type IVb pilin [Sphingomonas sp.]
MQLITGATVQILTHFLRNQTGASAAEYALILAIVGAAIAVAAIGLGNSISGSMNSSGNKIANCGGGC